MKLYKFKFLRITLLSVILIGLSSFGEVFFGAEFLKPSAAKKKWGILTFKADKFKTLGEKEKGAMATDVIEKKIYIGKDMLLIRNELGTPDSYFFSDTIYAYKITEPAADKESWHLIFIPDEKLEKVKDVKIHKKCCYKSPL